MCPLNEQNNEPKKSTPIFESWSILKGRVKDGTFGEIKDDWKWIFGYSKKYKGAIFFYVLLGILSTSFGLASSVAGKYLIDIITGYKTDKLVLLILIMLGGSVFSIVFNNVISRITAKLGIDISNDIQADIFDKIIDADWLALNDYSNGDILNRFNGDVSTVCSNAITWIPSIIIAFYRFFATFFVIFNYNVIMAFIALGSAPFLLLVSRIVIKKQRDYGKKVRAMSSDMMAFEVDTFYNMDSIKSFGVTPHYGKKLRWWQKRFRDVSLEYNLFSIKTNVFLSVIGMVVQFISFGYCLYLLWNHLITYGTMTLFLQQGTNLSNAFNSIIGVIPSFLNGSVSAHRIRELVELPKEVHIEPSEELNQQAKDGFTVSIRGVDFAYREGKDVITSSDMIARPGEIIALIGPSGEGKTTMVRLILGLIHPQQGDVTLHSLNGEEIRVNADTRHLFSYVPQGNTVLSGTIAENMRMVKEDATEEEIIEALRTACAWDFVANMPESIHSKVGERGKGLSEGQAQRISIARALLRDAPILLLDEATSALDVTTEREVLRNIVEKAPYKTCIVTTHRPSVLNLCRRVYRVVDTTVTELSEEEAGKMAMDF